ncbi:hypothetical protein [Thermomonas sp.]|uniref:hypothetical protein n=1 Tax=Thermomonas sp. TaxID=1971895 RepID=UPI0035AF42C2
MNQAARGKVGVGGFGLIELMIALVLGLLVIGAAFAVFQSNQSTFRANEGLNRIQESARVVFELLSRDLRAAGGSACSNQSFVESVPGSEPKTALFRDTPVSGDGSQLTVSSGDDTAYRVTGSTSSSVTLDPAQIADARDAFKKDDWLILCNMHKTFVVQASAVSATTLSFASLPDGYDPANPDFSPPAAVSVARLRSNRWFVAPNARGGNSLFVSRLGGAGEEVADGVQDMAVTYLESGGNTYTNAPASWNNVAAVRINLVLAGRDVDGNALTRTTSNVISLRSRAL